MRKRLLACGHFVSGREMSRVGQNQWWCFEHRRWEYAAEDKADAC